MNSSINSDDTKHLKITESEDDDSQKTMMKEFLDKIKQSALLSSTTNTFLEQQNAEFPCWTNVM